MHAILSKPWGPHAAEVAIADNAAEAAELGAVEVAPIRFEYLRANGFLKTVASPVERKAAPVVSSAVEPAPSVAAEPVELHQEGAVP